MHTITVYGTDPKDPTVGRDHQWPSTWSECTLQQLGTVGALTSVGIAEGADQETRDRAEAHLRLTLLRELTAMADQVFERIDVSGLLGIRYDENGAESVALLPGLDWCLEEPVFDTSIVPEVVVSTGRKRTTYTGPTDRLSRLTVKQWGFADAMLTRVASTGDMADVHLLMAALYHPEGERWDNSTMEVHAERMATLDDRTKLAAVMNYRGLRNWLAKKYWRCFKGGKADPHGLQGMVVRLAGPKHGTIPKTYEANLHDVMVDVEQKIMDMPTGTPQASPPQG